MSRDILVVTIGRDIQWMETRDAVKLPTNAGQPRQQRITQTQNVNSAEAEKPDGTSQNSTDSFYHFFSNVSLFLRHRNEYLKQFKNSLSREFFPIYDCSNNIPVSVCSRFIRKMGFFCNFLVYSSLESKTR